MPFASDFEVVDRLPDVEGMHPAVKSVSAHAWDRWCERSGFASGAKKHKKKQQEWNRQMLHFERALRSAVEVELKPEFRALAIINNGFRPARYFRGNGFVFVVGDRGVLLTVHQGEANRWQLTAAERERQKQMMESFLANEQLAQVYDDESVLILTQHSPPETKPKTDPVRAGNTNTRTFLRMIRKVENE